MALLSKKVGYIKSINKGFDFQAQRDSLRDAGCVIIYRDIISSSKKRDGFKELLKNVSKGDTIVVQSLDRLGSSITQFLETIDSLIKRDLKLVSLMDSIGFESEFSLKQWSSILINMMSKMHIERTEPARMGALARGRMGGRPEKISEYQKKSIKRLYYDKNMAIKHICDKFNISRPTVYKYLK